MPRFVIFLLGLCVLGVVIPLLVPLMSDFIDPVDGLIASIPDVQAWEIGMWAMFPVIMGLIFLGWLIWKYIMNHDQPQ